MTLTPKESALLKDLRGQELLCVEKYENYARQAKDGQLRSLFRQIAQTEQEHVNTLDRIVAGAVPQMNTGGGQPQDFPTTESSDCSEEERQADCYLCSDALSTEKHVSATYNTCIFEFRDTKIRDALNHMQKEEQQHGEQIYNYMAKQGMYQ